MRTRFDSSLPRPVDGGALRAVLSLGAAPHRRSGSCAGVRPLGEGCAGMVGTRSAVMGCADLHADGSPLDGEPVVHWAFAAAARAADAAGCSLRDTINELREALP